MSQVLNLSSAGVRSQPREYARVLVPMLRGVPTSTMPRLLASSGSAAAEIVLLHILDTGLDPVSAYHPVGIPGVVHVFAEGEPATVVVSVAERLRCDLVVLPIADETLRVAVLALATFHWDVMLVTDQQRAGWKG